MSLKNTIYDTGIDVERLWPLTEHFKQVRKELADEFNLTMPARSIRLSASTRFPAAC